MKRRYDIIVVGGGHAGAEAAWAASNLLRPAGGRVALVTIDPSKVGVMSCNPAIGGLAKGQMVREIDALGGIMGRVADATGIQFKVLNQSKGPAVRGPRCQSDKYAYRDEVQRLLATRENLDILAGTAERLIVEDGRCTGLVFKPSPPDGPAEPTDACCGEFGAIDFVEKPQAIEAGAVVLTTGTFMRGLMHVGEQKTEGGRVGEAPARTISDTLRELGFELGRLKTGTPPRLAKGSLDLSVLEEQWGDDPAVAFSVFNESEAAGFPPLEQVCCWVTHTSQAIHDTIRANLDRAPIYNGDIDSGGPRYCPSIEDKVVRFADRVSHHVFLEPESLRTDEIYCNGISTSLPADVQDQIVRGLPGCERAEILRYGYAVEYDMVWPHQIDVTTMTKRLPGLFLAGQINGTSGYEEAAGQGLLAGLNAVRFTRGEELIRLGREQAYIGVMMDDLVTKTPREPYRMFTSRAEHRLLLRADNADDRLTPMGRQFGLVGDEQWAMYQSAERARKDLRARMGAASVDGTPMLKWVLRQGVTAEDVLGELAGDAVSRVRVDQVLSVLRYAGYIDRQQREVERLTAQESAALPRGMDYTQVPGLRTEAALTLSKFQPTTLGQAGRLAGVNPPDLMILRVAVEKLTG